MRIISGLWRGRKLKVPDVDTTRPTMDRTREAVFGMLRSREAVMDARVLDVFAGSGAYGFEALSQGAAHVTFFEQHRVALQVLRDNVAQLGCAAQTTIISGDAQQAPAATGPAANLAFFDPPYHQGLLAPAVAHLAAGGWIDLSTFLILEIENRETPPEGISILNSNTYGTSKIFLAKLNKM